MQAATDYTPIDRALNSPSRALADDFEADDVEEQQAAPPMAAQPKYAARAAAPVMRQGVKQSTSPTYSRGPLSGNALASPAMPTQMMRPPMQQQQQQPQAPAYAPQQPAYDLPPQRRFIAPPSQASSQQRQQRAERLKALMRPGVLQLRDVDITLYEQAPLTPYELQTRFGSRTSRAKTTQTGDKNPSIKVQTDEVEVLDDSMQWPEDGPGAGSSTATLESSESARTTSLLTANTGRLRRFLLSAGQVVETLCMENLMAASGRAIGFNEANSLPHSQRHATLELPPALGTRFAHDLTFDAGGGMLLAAFGKPVDPPPLEDNGDEPDLTEEERKVRKRDLANLRRLRSGGLLATWRLYRPDAPWTVMRCVGVPSCCLLDPAKPHLAFAGTDEGSVQLWNLREAGSSHPSVKIDGGDRITMRSPTYASDCMANSNVHDSAIVQLAALPVAGEEGELHVGSLDAEGTLILWVVLEGVDIDATDLGQAFDGKERLLRTVSVPLTADLPPAASSRGSEGLSASALSVLPTRIFSMHFLPTDPSRLVLATDLPHLLHKSRYVAAPGSPAAPPPTPAAYAPDSELTASSGACGVAFCPDSTSHFVAGRSDGTIALYHVDDARPLLSWAGFATGAITQVIWSASRPSVVWALDSADTLHAIDITDASGRPFVSSRMSTDGSGRRGNARAHGGGTPAGGDGAKRPVRFALDRRAGEAAGGRGGAEAGQRLVAAASRIDGAPGGIEVHVLTEQCATAQPNEATKLAHFLRRL